MSSTDLRFTDVASESHCLNTHSKVRLSGKFDNIMPWLSSVGAAVCAADYDNDGFVDFYVTNSGHASLNRLFHNLGNGKFADSAIAAGVADCNAEGASMDAIFFDYDNDGDQDLYLVKWSAPYILYENLGNGKFADVTQRAGVGFWGNANGTIAFDYNRDGWLDIFVANYFADSVLDPATNTLARNDLWNPVTTKIMHTTFTHAVNGGRNVLFKNMHDGTFKDVTYEAGVGHTGWSLDAGSGDLNNDGWPDLYVANDFGADELYFNTGATENPPRFRLVIDPDGHPGIGNDWWKGMNVDIADVDGNGRMDIYVTNILARHYKTDEGNM
ncbi:MAG TPA: VCBS repeat-containing protein, partial [Bacteroidota bacterium]|nr:VCBS repeat-containing protein [Bacteroidota bacterium]